jgi:hypothetical protein
MCWTESVAVGSSEFVEETRNKLGIMGRGRKIEAQQGGMFVLKEEFTAYDPNSPHEMRSLSAENSYYLDDTSFVLVC